MINRRIGYLGFFIVRMFFVVLFYRLCSELHIAYVSGTIVIVGNHDWAVIFSLVVRYCYPIIANHWPRVKCVKYQFLSVLVVCSGHEIPHIISSPHKW